MSIEQNRSRKLAFLRIDEETRSLLKTFLPRLRQAMPDILDRFYAHVTGEDHLARMFTGESHIASARQAQMRHWERMFSGRFDEEYFQSVERIGKAHSRLGLEPGWYIGGYALVKQEIIALVLADLAGGLLGKSRRVHDATKLLQAVDKAITLDMDLSIALYLAEKDRDFSERLEQLSDQFGEVIASISVDLSEAADKLTKEVGGVETNVEKTNNQVTVAASGAEEASTNLQAVASASEQLSSSIGEISRQVNDGARVTTEAVQKSDEMTDSVSVLRDAAERVGGIVRLIEEIAEQTNLLALNATIEAARAGEAGRGFAVVAGEVKSLAQQTGKATGEISDQIKEIQAITRTVGGHIESIGKSIGGVETVSSAIASAIEEQTSVTQDISRNVSEAANGSGAVSEAIHAVSAAAAETRHSAGSLAEVAAQVNEKAENLKRESAIFIDRIRTANDRANADQAA